MKKSARLLSIVLALLMVISMVPFAAFAETTADIGDVVSVPDKWDGTADTAWYNTTDKTFNLSTAEQLAGLSTLSANGNTFSGKTIVLDADMDLDGKQWNPIKQFSGTFDGGKHTVSNFTLDGTADRAGFIQNLGQYPATVKNLTLSKVIGNAASNQYFGILVANGHSSVLENVHVVDCEITTTNKDAWVGGIYGYFNWTSASNCTVENLVIDATNGAKFIGGFSGNMDQDLTINNVDITGLKITLDATNGACQVGGFTGQTQTGHRQPTFTNCDVKGLEIVAKGEVQLGGFVGDAGAHTIANKCTVEGKIDASGVTDDRSFIGGFMADSGWNNNESSKGGHKLTNCSTEVDIITGGSTAGGFIGSTTAYHPLDDSNRNMPITMTNCSATGTVSIAEGATATIGGFAGEAERGTFTDCVADQEPFIGYLVPDKVTIVNNVAQISGTKYASLQAAVDAAKDGDTIALIGNVELTDTVVTVNAPGKLTLDLNGHTLTGTFTKSTQAFVSVTGGCNLTILDSTADQKGGIHAVNTNGNLSNLIRVETDATMVIESGNYTQDASIEGAGMIDSRGDEIITINGGNFSLGNIATKENGSPWILNVSGQNSGQIIVNGGTYNENILDLTRKYRWEVDAPQKMIEDNGDGTYTVVDAPFSAGIKYTPDGHYDIFEVGYATLEEIFSTSDENAIVDESDEYVIVTKDVTLTENIETKVPILVVEDVTIDLNGHTITGGQYRDSVGALFQVYPIIRVQNDAKVTVKNGSIKNEDYVFVLGASDGSSAGYLTIEDGTYEGNTSVASVTKGELTINGGDFSVNSESSTYLLNCVDANYKDGSAKITVKGGTFKGFNPADNAAENPKANFCADGYTSEEIADGVYGVRALNYVAEVNGVKYEFLKEALEACTNGETVKLIADVTYDKDDVVSAHGGATGFGKYDQYNPSIIYIGGTKGATEAENQPSNVNAVLDLNGHTITNKADAYLFLLMDNCKVTFKDSAGGGKVVTTTDAPVIWTCGTDTLVTIEGGEYVTASATGLLHVTHSGDLVITGGEFKTTADDASLLIMLNSQPYNNPNYFLKGVATVTISGGTFYGFNPAKVGDDYKASSLEDIKFVDGCAEGYVPVDNGNCTYGVKEWYDENADTLYINNIYDLCAFADAVNAGKTCEGQTIVLNADIDLSGLNWTPIGNDSKYFCGSFDGGDHTISNMTININSTDNVFAGLFGGVKKATVKNLEMTNVSIDAVGAKVRAAAVVGIAHSNSETRTDATINFENITVDGCTINATATSSSALVGGVVGYSYPANMTGISVSDLTIDAEGNEVRAAAINGYVCGQNISNNSNTRAPFEVKDFDVKNVSITADAYTVFAGGYAPYTYYGYITLEDGTIDGLKIDVDAHQAFVGGLVGYFWRSDNGHTVKNVNITGIDFDVTTDYLGETRVGGVVGTSQSPRTTYTDVSVSGKIVERCSDPANPVNYHAKVGGFVARTYEYAQQTYTNCVADVDVTGSHVAGGFVGNHNSTVSYENCEAKGDVTANIAGGFAGRLTEHGYTTDVTFDSCSASGAVNGTKVTGGFIGSTVNHGWAAWVEGAGTNYTKAITINDCTYSGKLFGENYAQAKIGNTYYATLAQAVVAAAEGDVVTVIRDFSTSAAIVIDKNITLDLNGKSITTAATEAGNYVDAFTILADVTVTGEGTIDARPSHGYTFYVGDKEGNAGGLIIENGTFYGETSVVNNRLGEVIVNGGTYEVSLENVGDTYDFVLNCIDANYNNGTAKIVVKGGTFKNFNPADNEAETGDHTNFCAKYYEAIDNNDNTYTVKAVSLATVKVEAIAGVWLTSEITGANLDDLYAALGEYTNVPVKVTLNADIDLTSEGLTIAGNANKVIDLNGKTLTGMVINRVDLTVIDSVGDGKIDGGDKAAIDNYGKLVVSGGEFTGEMCAIYNNSNADLTINGGKFTAPGDYYATIENRGGTLTVNGGTITATQNAGYAIVDTMGVTTINGGEINSAAGTAVETYNGKITIKDGKFTGKVIVENQVGTVDVYGGTLVSNTPEYYYGLTCANGGVTTLYGGIYERDYATTAGTSVKIAEGYAAEKNSEGNYVVKKLITVTINNVTYVRGNDAPKFTYTYEGVRDGDEILLAVNMKDFDFETITTGEHDIDGEGYVFMRDDYIVRVVPGKLTVVDAVAKIEGQAKVYASIQDAVVAAENGDVITILKDHELTYTGHEVDGLPVLVAVDGKSITIDLNGKKITGNSGKSDLTYYAAFAVDNDGSLTLKDSVGIGSVSITGDSTMYSLLMAYEYGANNATKLIVEGGSYYLEKAHDCLIFCGQRADDLVYIKGGNFTLGNVGVGENGKPWIFNVVGQGDGCANVSGGTFNADVNRQHWSKEVYVDKTCYTVDNGDGTWTVKDGAVAYVNQGMLNGPYFYRKDVGYATVEEALEVADENETVTLLKDCEANYVLVTPGVTLDLNGKTLTAEYVVGFNGSAVYDSSAENTGRIKVAKNNVVLDQSNAITVDDAKVSYLPVYNAVENCYRFAVLKTFNTALSNETNSETNEQYKHFIALAYPGTSGQNRKDVSDLIAEGAEASGVKLVVRLSWTGGSYSAHQDYEYTDAMVKDVYGDYNKTKPGTYFQRFTADFTGGEFENAVDIAKISLVVISETGVELQSTPIDFI